MTVDAASTYSRILATSFAQLLRALATTPPGEIT
jgi:hypothetical protein